MNFKYISLLSFMLTVIISEKLYAIEYSSLENSIVFHIGRTEFANEQKLSRTFQELKNVGMNLGVSYLMHVAEVSPIIGIIKEFFDNMPVVGNPTSFEIRTLSKVYNVDEQVTFFLIMDFGDELYIDGDFDITIEKQEFIIWNKVNRFHIIRGNEILINKWANCVNIVFPKADIKFGDKGTYRIIGDFRRKRKISSMIKGIYPTLIDSRLNVTLKGIDKNWHYDGSSITNMHFLTYSNTMDIFSRFMKTYKNIDLPKGCRYSPIFYCKYSWQEEKNTEYWFEFEITDKLSWSQRQDLKALRSFSGSPSNRNYFIIGKKSKHQTLMDDDRCLVGDEESMIENFKNFLKNNPKVTK